MPIKPNEDTNTNIPDVAIELPIPIPMIGEFSIKPKEWLIDQILIQIEESGDMNLSDNWVKYILKEELKIKYANAIRIRARKIIKNIFFMLMLNMKKEIDIKRKQNNAEVEFCKSIFANNTIIIKFL